METYIPSTGDYYPAGQWTIQEYELVIYTKNVPKRMRNTSVSSPSPSLLVVDCQHYLERHFISVLSCQILSVSLRQIMHNFAVKKLLQHFGHKITGISLTVEAFNFLSGRVLMSPDERLSQHIKTEDLASFRGEFFSVFWLGCLLNHMRLHHRLEYRLENVSVPGWKYGK